MSKLRHPLHLFIYILTILSFAMPFTLIADSNDQEEQPPHTIEADLPSTAPTNTEENPSSKEDVSQNPSSGDSPTNSNEQPPSLESLDTSLPDREDEDPSVPDDSTASIEDLPTNPELPSEEPTPAIGQPTPTPVQEKPTNANRPNFLIIVSDDQPAHTMGRYMPITQKKIFDQGISFTRAYVTTPACCPSRVSMLTGLFASRHGVTETSIPLKRETVIHELQRSGYFTGHLGKYLQSSTGEKRSEYDYWVGMQGGRSTYYHPRLNVQGKWKQETGYMTTILEKYAVDFLEKAKNDARPFLLWFAPNAPHNPFTPERRYKNMYMRRPLPMKAIQTRTAVGKPRWVRAKAHLASKNISKKNKVDYLRRLQLACLWSLDKTVGNVITKLDELGFGDNTIVIYVSDNGIFWGEQFIGVAKEAPYEPAVHVPMALRYRQKYRTGQIRNELVANIDIGATIYKAAGIIPEDHLDGISLFDIIDKNVPPRSQLFFESTRLVGMRHPWNALIKGNFKYILNREDLDELYDLSRDIYEERNLLKNPRFAKQGLALRADLEKTLSTILKSIN